MEARRERIQKRVAELTATWPVVFESRERRVRLYDVGCALSPSHPDCPPGAAGGL